MADTRAAMFRLSALVGEHTLFENDSYRRLWLSKLLSHVPVNAVVYTMLILVVQETGRAFFSSLFIVAYIAPTALLGTISGVIVDRLPKGVVLAATNATRAGLCVLLAMSTDNLVAIYVIAVLLAVGSQLAGPAESASLPAIVPRRDLTAANSLNNLQTLISQVVGLMVLPVVFLQTIGPEALAIVCAGLFAGSAFNFLLIGGLGGAVSEIPISVKETRERFAEAWSKLMHDSTSYVSMLIVVLASTTGFVVVTLLPRFSTRVLGVTVENIIFVAAPAAIGIWLAMRFVGNVSRRFPHGWTIGIAFSTLVAGVMLLAFVRPIGDAIAEANLLGLFDPGPFGQHSARILVSSVIGAGLAFSYTFVNILGRSIINERMPREMQGRIFAGQTVLINLASIPPVLLTGLLADIVGVAPVFFLVAMIAAVLAIYYTARNMAMPARVAY